MWRRSTHATAVVRRYDELYLQGGWTRRRLLLKVADDPLRPSTTRQLLIGLGVVAVFARLAIGGQQHSDTRPRGPPGASDP